LIHSWTAPATGGRSSCEFAFGFLRGRAVRVLVVPALFEEANRTRRMVVEALRRLDAAGIDAVLPDLPGCNESLAAFADQTLECWRAAMAAAATHFAATHVLTVRGGALVAPSSLSGWALDPAKGASLLRQLLRARALASREAGRPEGAADLLETGRAHGLYLAGYPCSAALIAGLEAAAAPAGHWRAIAQAELGGGALWLRSEPGEDPGQSERLAAIVAAEIAA
jgi:hypothetical protein